MKKELSHIWYYDEYANESFQSFDGFVFVQKSKKPRWFWKIYRWIYSKLTGKHVISGHYISTPKSMLFDNLDTCFKADDGTIYYGVLAND